MRGTGAGASTSSLPTPQLRCSSTQVVPSMYSGRASLSGVVFAPQAVRSAPEKRQPCTRFCERRMRVLPRDACLLPKWRLRMMVSERESGRNCAERPAGLNSICIGWIRWPVIDARKTRRVGATIAGPRGLSPGWVAWRSAAKVPLQGKPIVVQAKTMLVIALVVPLDRLPCTYHFVC